MVKPWIVVVLVLMSCSMVAAQIEDWESQLEKHPDDVHLLLQLGRHYHDTGGSGDAKAAKEAESYLRRLLEIDPNHGRGLVYLGSVLTMRARDVKLPWDKMKFMKQGFSRMDRAVALEPDVREIRLTRGINSVSVPAMFGRLSVALEDFEAIAFLVENDEAGLDFMLKYLLHYGLALKAQERMDEANVRFQEVMTRAPDSEYARRARVKMGEVNDEQ